MSSSARRSFDQFIDLTSCATGGAELQVECRSGVERLPEANSPLPRIGGRARRGARHSSVILSLLNISTETQAQPRLAVLCREVVGGGSVSRRWHQAYRVSPSIPSFGLSAIRCAQVTRGDRMLALPPFTAAADSRANAKQEGIP